MPTWIWLHLMARLHYISQLRKVVFILDTRKFKILLSTKFWFQMIQQLWNYWSREVSMWMLSTIMALLHYMSQRRTVRRLFSWLRRWNDIAPLTWSSIPGRIRAVEVLILNGVNVNAADKDGKTPLDMARTNGNAYIIQLLIKNGAKGASMWNVAKL